MTEEVYRGNCATLRDAGVVTVRCCTSCHVDAEEYGYDLLTHYLPDGSYVMVCCTVGEDLDGDEALAALLKKEND